MGTVPLGAPSLRSRLAAGILGGAGALGITITLAVVQAGNGSSDAREAAAAGHAAGAHRAATRSAGTAGSSASVPLSTTTTGPGAPPATSTAPVSDLAAGGIPATALAAYRNAALLEAATDRSCRLPWALLAGIGRVESDHGRFAGAVLHSDGVSTPPIIGIALNGHGTEVVRDTDGGRLDGDPVYDRAVGPMQFIPSTWTGWGRDGNHDGRRDPFNIFDAAAAAAAYLCAAGGDLGTATGQETAVLTYNHSDAYLAEVLGLEKVYARQFGVTIPDLPAVPGGHPRAGLPPADPVSAPAGDRTGATPTSPGSATRPGRPPATPPSSRPGSTAPPTHPPTTGSSTSPCAPASSSSSGTPTGSPTSPSSGSSSSSGTPCAPTSSAPSSPAGSRPDAPDRTG